MTSFPELFLAAENIVGRLVGYVMAKIEGTDENYHGHISAISIAPEARRQGLSTRLMNEIERMCEKKGCYFIDLFVRESNEVAISLYKKLGYSIYRTIIGYYSDDDEMQNTTALDMRKPLSKDVQKKSLVIKQNVITASELLR